MSADQLLPKLEALEDEDLRTVYQELCKAYHAIDDFRTKHHDVAVREEDENGVESSRAVRRDR